MSTWAKENASRMISEELSRTAASEQLVEDQKLRLHLAPRLWAQLRDILKERCEELNLELGSKLLLFEVQPSSEAIVRRLSRPATLRVVYDNDAFRIHYECGAGRGEYLFRVNPDSSVEIATVYHVPHTPEAIAEILLGLLLKSPF